MQNDIMNGHGLGTMKKKYERKTSNPENQKLCVPAFISNATEFCGLLLQPNRASFLSQVPRALPVSAHRIGNGDSKSRVSIPLFVVTFALC